jgi:hypothetical protein
MTIFKFYANILVENALNKCQAKMSLQLGRNVWWMKNLCLEHQLGINWHDISRDGMPPVTY